EWPIEVEHPGPSAPRNTDDERVIEALVHARPPRDMREASRGARGCIGGDRDLVEVVVGRRDRDAAVVGHLETRPWRLINPAETVAARQDRVGEIGRASCRERGESWWGFVITRTALDNGVWIV